MSSYFQPGTPEELRDCLRDSALAAKSISLFGRNTKTAFGGSPKAADISISTAGLRRILRYEPADLTLSVEAGMPFAELQAELSQNGQMLPLDGPFAGQGTVGGVVAANLSGPIRRMYGTARDLVIGMRFATLDGRLADTGGMVVKNVAGLDLAKLMIGSFGTFAAIVSVNFKVIPKPKESRTFLFCVETLEEARKLSALLMASQWNPGAVEVLNPALSAEMSLHGFTVASAFGGNSSVLERLARELAQHGDPVELTGQDQDLFWQSLQMVTQRVLEGYSQGAIVRVYTPVSEAVEALELAGASIVAQAGPGILRVWFPDVAGTREFLAKVALWNWEVVVEAASAEAKSLLTLWPKPGGDFVVMERIKRMFDPQGLLNSGRLYDRL